MMTPEEKFLQDYDNIMKLERNQKEKLELIALAKDNYKQRCK